MMTLCERLMTAMVSGLRRLKLETKSSGNDTGGIGKNTKIQNHLPIFEPNQVGVYAMPDGTCIPIYRETDRGKMGSESETMKLLTKMVNELREENKALKSGLMKRSFEHATHHVMSNTSSLATQIGDIEAGKVISR